MVSPSLLQTLPDRIERVEVGYSHKSARNPSQYAYDARVAQVAGQLEFAQEKSMRRLAEAALKGCS